MNEKVYPLRAGDRLDGYIFSVVHITQNDVPNQGAAASLTPHLAGYFVCYFYIYHRKDIPIQPVACLSGCFFFIHICERDEILIVGL